MPDRPEDIKPRFHRSKAQGLKDQGDHVSHPHLPQTEDDDDLDEDDDETNAEWNLRKCAAASLDVLSGVFGDSFLVNLLPILKETLFHDRWEVCFLVNCNEKGLKYGSLGRNGLKNRVLTRNRHGILVLGLN